jgi:hypothetical protein
MHACKNCVLSKSVENVIELTNCTSSVSSATMQLIIATLVFISASELELELWMWDSNQMAQTVVSSPMPLPLIFVVGGSMQCTI